MRFVDRALSNGRSIRVRSTDRSDGDFAVGGEDPNLDARRRNLCDRPWVWLHQVHGAACLDVDQLGIDAATGADADASVTSSDTVALCVQTADCLPMVLWSDDGIIAAVHIGWRGLEAGVVEAALVALRHRSSAQVHAFLGPSIGPECYEFGVDERHRLEERFGNSVIGTTATGAPALDVRSAVRSELEHHSVQIDIDDDRCTACDGAFFSYRARRESERQTTVVWIEQA